MNTDKSHYKGSLAHSASIYMQPPSSPDQPFLLFPSVPSLSPFSQCSFLFKIDNVFLQVLPQHLQLIPSLRNSAASNMRTEEIDTVCQTRTRWDKSALCPASGPTPPAPSSIAPVLVTVSSCGQLRCTHRCHLLLCLELLFCGFLFTVDNSSASKQRLPATIHKRRLLRVLLRFRLTTDP